MTCFQMQTHKVSMPFCGWLAMKIRMHHLHRIADIVQQTLQYNFNVIKFTHTETHPDTIRNDTTIRVYRDDI